MTQDKQVEIDVLEFIDTLDSLTSLDDLIRTFETLIARYGYESFRCAEILRLNQPIDPQKAFGELHKEWSVRYRDQDYVHVDSSVQLSLQTRYPFTWSSLRKHRRISSLAERIFEEAEHDFKYADGLLVPIHLADGSVSVVSLIGEKPDVRGEVIRGLGMAAVYLHSKANPLIISDDQIASKQFQAPVSPRQLDCIQWVAEGKSDWEISKILGISESTVHNHVERAKRTLGVNTRVQAVVEAVRRRLIVP